MHVGGTQSGSLIQQIHRSEQTYRQRLLQLSTGRRINSAADGPATMAMISRLDAEIRSSVQASRNISDSVSLSSVADAGTQGITDNIQRINELSVRAANDTLSASDRQSIQQEINHLRDGIDSIASSTQFNQRPLLDGTFTNQTFQVGTGTGDSVNLSIASMSSATLGLDQIDVATTAGAQAGIDSAAGALDSALASRTRLGAFQQSMEARASNLGASRIGHVSTRSQMQDTDFAATVSSLRTSIARNASSLAALAHYNASENSILRLFG